MQATVAEFDAQTGTGVVLLDDGHRVEFGGAAFAASGLRLLRLGQRVQVEYRDGDPTQEVIKVTLPTMRDQPGAG